MDYITYALFASFVILFMIMDHIHSKITQILKDNGYNVAKYANRYSVDIKNFKKLLSEEKNEKNILHYKYLIKRFKLFSTLVVINIILILMVMVVDVFIL
ncbi:MAG: hypothetical protein GY756_03950 [bacterium]|nr:hypothetical protein [bacterium]